MNTKKLKQLVLDLAIHGKLVPQDPNDEPASELLKRIKENVETHGRACKSKKTAISSEEIDEMPFDVPTGWCWTNIKEICSKIGSGSTPRGSNYSEAGIPFFRSQNVYNNGLVYEDIKYISEETHKSMIGTEVHAEDLLLNITGGSLGRCAVVPNDFERGNVSQHVCILRTFIEPHFLHAFILSDHFSSTMILSGSGREGLPKYSLEAMLIPLPPLAEQHRIVAAIEKWFAVIDQLESNEGDLMKSIEQTKKKVLDLAIHGKLVKQDESDEPASELLKRIKENVETHGRACKGKKAVSQDIDLDEVPFDVPKGWVWTTIGVISSNILYGVNESAKDSGKYKLLRITDIQDNKVDWDTVPYTNFDEKKVSEYLLKKNDILFARTGATVGKSYLVEDDIADCIYASYLIKVQTCDFLYSKYVKRFFESGYYWEQISDNSIGTGQPNVNGTLLASLTIPLPPLSEQKRIVAKVEEVFGELERMGEMLG